MALLFPARDASRRIGEADVQPKFHINSTISEDRSTQMSPENRIKFKIRGNSSGDQQPKVNREPTVFPTGYIHRNSSSDSDHDSTEDEWDPLPEEEPPTGQETQVTREISEDEEIGPIAKMAAANVEQLLRVDGEQPDSVINYLLKTISNLEMGKDNPGKVESANTEICTDADVDSAITTISRYETYHVVPCDGARKWYRDIPLVFEWDYKDDHFEHYQGAEEATPIDLTKHNHIAFLVLDIYLGCCGDMDLSNRQRKAKQDAKKVPNAPVLEKDRSEILLNDHLKEALVKIIDSNPETFRGFVSDGFPQDLLPPYTLFRVHNETIKKLSACSGLDDRAIFSVSLLCRWFDENLGAQWAEADEMIARNKINGRHLGKIWRPDEIILKSDSEGNLFALRTLTWPEFDLIGMKPFCWKFNGNFMVETERIVLFPTSLRIGDDELEITSLKAYPLRFASQDVYAQLASRGEKFWNCRTKRLVCYKESTHTDPTEAECRCMIDYHMYKLMHPENPLFSPIQVTDTTYTGRHFSPDEMERQKEIDSDFFVLLPPFIHGFDLQAKAWVKLPVDRITDVRWNKDAFKRLVIPKETKELIQAMIAGQSSQSRTPLDIIAGKGKGLVILLHGGPGTGKTLTAESIAELEERPLYRVTCGDIGTEPEEVEEYLKTTLHIGKSWGCVVLLDEADVFIEERTLADLKRNAIISVFLRVLEYYDGILILTSNRVGTFDEAFKSRIQLALRYPNLDAEQRQEIWKNFFQMLQKAKEHLDINDLMMNLDSLADVEINGRQIRSVVTMGRHLAKFRKERLVYRHLQQAISTVTKFDEYLAEVKGCTDDNWARADKVR